MNQIVASFLNKIQNCWVHLTDPSNVKDAEQFRKARILNRILLPLIVMGFIVQIQYNLAVRTFRSTEVIIYGTLAILLVAFALSRSGKFNLGIILTFASTSLGLFIFVIVSYSEFEVIGVLYYLIIPIMLAEFFLDRRGYLIITVLILLGILGLRTFEVGNAVIDLFFYFVVLFIVVWFISHARHQLEIERQASLSASEANLAALIENSPDHIWSIDRNARLVLGNKHFFNWMPHVLGRRPKIGDALLDETLPRAYLEEWQGYFNRALAGEQFNVEVGFGNNENQQFVEYRFNPIYSPTGQVTGAAMMARDITERKMTERMLLKDNDRLEQRVMERTIELVQASRAKDEFLANMSHELRTPLNGIMGFSESLEEGTYGALQPRQLTALRTITESGRHLLELINDILDLSKIEAGKLELQLEAVKVEALCMASLRIVKQPAAQKELKVSLTIDGSIDMMQVDRRRIKQMIVNLLSNAVKFTPKGGQMGLEVSRESEDAVRFTVWDTGIGIPNEKLQKLFKPFVQLDSSLSRQYAGTGLGLALVHDLAELHGGQVGVESQVGKGSRFFFVIPQRSMQVDSAGGLAPFAQSPSLETPADGQDKHMCILLAEDNAANMVVTYDFLEAHGFQVVSAVTGLEAIENTQAHKPDLILMDIQMPGINGLEAIRRIRAMPEFTSVPIIALTALAMAGDRERCIEAGANEYLAKPVVLKDLLKEIKALLKE
ncbi:MAG: ATP-binding protein [Anaerolineales bacterium]